MAHYPLLPLSALCEIKTGRKDVNQGNTAGEYPFFTCAKDHTYSETYSFDCEAILIAGNGVVGNTSYYNGKFEAYQRTYVLTDFVDVDPWYLYLVLEGTLREVLFDKKLGNTMPYIKKGMLSDHKIPLPEIKEQKRIVAILDQAFADIDKACALTEQNLKNARELFDSYLQQVFSQGGKDWLECKLGDIAEFKNGLNYSKNSMGETVKVAGVKDFQSNYAITTDEFDLVQIDGLLNPSYELKSGDILTVRSNGNKRLIGRCVLIENVDKKTSFSGFIIRIRLIANDVLPEFLTYYLKSSKVHEELIGSGGGANISNLNQKTLTNLLVVYPDLNVQRELIEMLGEVKEQSQKLIAVYLEKLDFLEDLKKSLLHRAFSGELTRGNQEAA